MCNYVENSLAAVFPIILIISPTGESLYVWNKCEKNIQSV